MAGDDELQLFQRMMQAFDTPAFLRRGQHVEGAWRTLLDLCRHQRRKLAGLPAMRLGRLLALAGNWSRLTAGFCTFEEADALQVLHNEWSPKLKLPVAETKQCSQIIRAINELAASFERFNVRWLKFIQELDLDHINELRDAYNRYYVLEKECATRSATTARDGFTPLKPVTVEDVLREFPLLKVPTGPV